MYNMNLGEKTNVKNGQTKGGHRVDQPLESYIPGVGRSNKASEAMFPHSSETQGGHHISHKDDKPLGSYIPGVGRNNDPTEHGAPQQSHVGHTESHQARSGHNSEPHFGRNATEQHQSKNQTPHIPGTGVITEPSQPMSKQKYDPKENTAYKMDTQQTPHLTQKTAVPGFNQGYQTHASGGSDTIDRASVPKPAHLNPSPDSGANAPVRRDSRTVNQFHEPGAQSGEPTPRVVRKEEETVVDFPAHSYDAAKGESQQKHSTLDPNTGNFGQQAKQSQNQHKISEEPEHTQGKTGIFGHESHGSQHGKHEPAHEVRNTGAFGRESHGSQHEKAHDLDKGYEGNKTNVFGHESHGSQHEKPYDLGQETTHQSKSTGNLGHEHHTQKGTHGADLNASEKSTESGPTLFGKSINFGGSSHKDDTHKDATHRDETGKHTSHNAGTGDIATKVGHVKTPNVESKHLPSKVATLEDQPVKSSNNQEGLAKNRTKSIGSEEAGSYAREVGNHPSLVDPRVPTYRAKDETFSPAGHESGADYQNRSKETNYNKNAPVGGVANQSRGEQHHGGQVHGQSHHGGQVHGQSHHGEQAHGQSHHGEHHTSQQRPIEETRGNYGQSHQGDTSQTPIVKTRVEETYAYQPESGTRSHPKEQAEHASQGVHQKHEEHEEHDEHSSPGLIEKVKNTITNHNNS